MSSPIYIYIYMYSVPGEKSGQNLRVTLNYYRRDQVNEPDVCMYVVHTVLVHTIHTIGKHITCFAGGYTYIDRYIYIRMTILCNNNRSDARLLRLESGAVNLSFVSALGHVSFIPRRRGFFCG